MIIHIDSLRPSLAVDALTAQKIRELHARKQEAVAMEEYDLAHDLKVAIERLKVWGRGEGRGISIRHCVRFLYGWVEDGWNTKMPTHIYNKGYLPYIPPRPRPVPSAPPPTGSRKENRSARGQETRGRRARELRGGQGHQDGHRQAARGRGLGRGGATPSPAPRPHEGSIHPRPGRSAGGGEGGSGGPGRAATSGEGFLGGEREFAFLGRRRIFGGEFERFICWKT